MPETNNYTLGRGKVHVARFINGLPSRHFRYIGNSPEFSLSIESEELDHYNSDEGIREKDDSVPLEVNRTGSLTTDNIHPENVAIFFFGDAEKVTQGALADQVDEITDIMPGHHYKLGVSPSNPAGHFGLAAGAGVTAAISGAGGTALVEGTDFTLDRDNGIITFLDTSIIAVAGVDVTVTYDVRAHSRDRIISGSTPVECSIMYVTKNPKGKDFVYMMPYVKLTPNGDFALKGDEWQNLPLSMEILKPADGDAILLNGKPVYA